MNNPAICLKLHYSCYSALQYLKSKALRASEIHKTWFSGSTLDNLVTHGLSSGYLQAKHLTYIHAMLQCYPEGLTCRDTSFLHLSSSLAALLSSTSHRRFSLPVPYHTQHPSTTPYNKTCFSLRCSGADEEMRQALHFHQMEIDLNCSL